MLNYGRSLTDCDITDMANSLLYWKKVRREKKFPQKGKEGYMEKRMGIDR